MNDNEDDNEIRIKETMRMATIPNLFFSTGKCISPVFSNYNNYIEIMIMMIPKSNISNANVMSSL